MRYIMLAFLPGLKMDNKMSKEKLDKIAAIHIKPHAAHALDCKVLAHDMDKVLSFVRGPKVLELGYGEGIWTEKLIKIFGHSEVVDASSRLCAHARDKYGDKVICHESFFEQFEPSKDIKYSTIIATHILEHVANPVEILRRAKKWLAIDGRMLIIVPNAASIHRRLAVLMGIQGSVHDFSPRDKEVGHVRVYDLPTLESDIADAGFRIVYRRGLFLKILPNSMMIEFPDGLLKALVDISDELPPEWMANLAVVIEPLKS